MPLGAKKVPPKKGGNIDTHVRRLRAIYAELKAIREENENILRKHFGEKEWEKRLARGDALREEAETETDLCKTEARKLAVVGETKVLYEGEDMFVSVSGTRPSIGYDLNIALDEWPKALVKSALVQVIDPKVVQTLIDNNQLTDDTLKLVSKARREEPQTAKVTVKPV